MASSALQQKISVNLNQLQDFSCLSCVTHCSATDTRWRQSSVVSPPSVPTAPVSPGGLCWPGLVCKRPFYWWAPVSALRHSPAWPPRTSPASSSTGLCTTRTSTSCQLGLCHWEATALDPPPYQEVWDLSAVKCAHQLLPQLEEKPHSGRAVALRRSLFSYGCIEIMLSTVHVDTYRYTCTTPRHDGSSEAKHRSDEGAATEGWRSRSSSSSYRDHQQQQDGAAA